MAAEQAIGQVTVEIVAASQQWVRDTVVGLSLCPFAGQPVSDGRVAYEVLFARDELEIFTELGVLFERLANNPETETTLLILPDFTDAFADFDALFMQAEELVVLLDCEGIYQLTHFHPEFVFDDAPKGSITHYAHRSPYPMIQILRESSVAAVQGAAGIDSISERNRERLLKLNADEQGALRARVDLKV